MSSKKPPPRKPAFGGGSETPTPPKPAFGKPQPAKPVFGSAPKKPAFGQRYATAPDPATELVQSLDDAPFGAVIQLDARRYFMPNMQARKALNLFLAARKETWGLIRWWEDRENHPGVTRHEFVFAVGRMRRVVVDVQPGQDPTAIALRAVLADEGG